MDDDDKNKIKSEPLKMTNSGAVLLEKILRQERYKDSHVLVQTAMSIIARATDTLLQKEVVIKLLLFDGSTESDLQSRFMREMQIMASLDHKNIVRIFSSAVTEDGYPYYVMELIQGRSLKQYLQHSAPMTPAKFFQIMDQVLEALIYAHESKIVHRDLKPSNIVITETDNGLLDAKVIDFGIAYQARTGDLAQSLTRTGCVLGTPQYMSPEQCRGEEAGVPSDIYSLACIMYECILNAPPALGETSFETMYKRMNSSVPSVEQMASSDTGRKLGRLIDACLQLDPSQRPQTAREVQAPFREIFAEPLEEFGIGSSTSAVKKSKNKIFVALIPVVLLLGIGSFAFVNHKQSVDNSNVVFETQKRNEKLQKLKQLEQKITRLEAELKSDKEELLKSKNFQGKERQIDAIFRYRYSPIILALNEEGSLYASVLMLSNAIRDREVFISQGDSRKWEILFLTQRSDCYVKLKMYDKAEDDLKLAEKYVSAPIDRSYTYYMLLSRIRLYLALDKLELAYKDFMELIPAFEKVGYEHQLGNGTLFNVPNTKDATYKLVAELTRDSNPSTIEGKNFKGAILAMCDSRITATPFFLPKKR